MAIRDPGPARPGQGGRRRGGAGDALVGVNSEVDIEAVVADAGVSGVDSD